MTPDLARTIVSLGFAGLVIFAAVRDIASYTIPNWVSAALALAFAPAAWMSGASLGVIGISLAIGAGVLAAGVGMFALGWLGGGDAKLMAAAALWVGLKGLAAFALFTGIAGGALALALLALRSAWLRPVTAGGPAWTQRLAVPGGPAPYGVAIAAGALAAYSAVQPF